MRRYFGSIHKQEGISVESQTPACQYYRLHSEQVLKRRGGGIYKMNKFGHVWSRTRGLVWRLEPCTEQDQDQDPVKGPLWTE